MRMSYQLSSSLRREMAEQTKRDIFGIYARSFSPPRIQKLADALINLDRLSACRLATEIDSAIGAAASEKLLKNISSPRIAASECALSGKKKRQRKKL